MPRLRQLSFLPRTDLQHGGNHRKGRRKIARPLDPRRPLHLTLRASRARGERSMLRPKYSGRIERLTERIARRREVRVYRLVNVGNHLHLLVQARTRASFQAFLRELAGSIAVMISGARKGAPSGKFWDKLAWSRIVTWGRDFQGLLKRYFVKNLFEAHGFYGRREKQQGLKIITIQLDPPPDE